MLSFLMQLAGIAASHPELRVEGAQIAVVVAGARGDDAAWHFRCLGTETIQTGLATIEAVKYVRDGRSAYDTRA